MYCKVSLNHNMLYYLFDSRFTQLTLKNHMFERLLGFIFSINLYCYMWPNSIWLCSVPNLLPYRFHWYLLSTCEAIFHRLWHNNNMMYKKPWKSHEWSILLCDDNIECLNCLLCTSNDAISDLCISNIKIGSKWRLVYCYWCTHFTTLIH